MEIVGILSFLFLFLSNLASFAKSVRSESNQWGLRSVVKVQRPQIQLLPFYLANNGRLAGFIEYKNSLEHDLTCRSSILGFPLYYWIVTQHLMNSWIQRNIIFPKIKGECPLLQQIQHSPHRLNPSPIQRTLDKKQSFNCFAPSPYKARKNYSIHIRNMDPLIISPKIKSPRKYLQPITNEQSEASSAIKKRLVLLGFLDDAGRIFESKNVLNRVNPLKDQSLPRFNKYCEIDPYPHTAIIQKQTNKKKIHKLKTEPIQVHLLSERHSQIYEHSNNECLSIRKAKTFDYNELTKQEHVPKEGKRHKYSKVRVVERLKEANLKITSIRGWNNEDETRDQMMPINSYAW